MRKVLTTALVLVLTLMACGSEDSDDNKQGEGKTCLERCQAIASNCSINPADCPTMCDLMTEKELHCMEATNCNPEAYQSCLKESVVTDDVVTEDVVRRQFDVESEEDLPFGTDESGQGCDDECDFEYCDESLGECVACLQDEHCDTAYNGPVCLFQGFLDATCGCESVGDCSGHPSGETCHSQKACSCSDDLDCEASSQGTRCVSVISDLGLSQCGCEDAALDCPTGMQCLGSKCM